MPGVSVVIPAYNPGGFLSEAVASVVAQSWEDWECVVIDDGSSQDLTWVTSVDPRVRLVRQTNQGLAAARNRGIQETTAALVAFLDADDLWEPEKLALQVQALEESNCMLVSTSFTFVDALGLVTAEGYASRAADYTDLLRGNGICASTVLVTRQALSLIGGFDNRLRRVEDWDAWLRIARLGRPLVHIDQNLACYRVHTHNMSAQYAASWAVSTSVLVRHLILALRRPDWAAARAAVVGIRRMAELYGAQGYDAFRRNRKARDLAWALTLTPLQTTQAIVRRLADSSDSRQRAAS